MTLYQISCLVNILPELPPAFFNALSNLSNLLPWACRVCEPEGSGAIFRASSSFDASLKAEGQRLAAVTQLVWRKAGIGTWVSRLRHTLCHVTSPVLCSLKRLSFGHFPKSRTYFQIHEPSQVKGIGVGSPGRKRLVSHLLYMFASDEREGKTAGGHHAG